MRNPSQALKERVCGRCGQALTWADKIAGVALSRPRCQSCRREVQALVEQAGEEFLQLARSARWCEAHRQRLSHQLGQAGVAPQEGWAQLQKRARREIEHILQTAENAPDGQAFDALLLPPEQEESLQHVMRAGELPAGETQRWHRRIQSLKALDRIRQGELPLVLCDLHLEGDEACHLNVPALFLRSSRGKTTPVVGRLIATSRKILFLPSQGSAWTMSYGHVLRVGRGPLWIDIELSAREAWARQGHGRYTVSHPAHCQAVIGSLSRLAKRQRLSSQSASSNGSPGSAGAPRYIPQEVKNAVWARDGGRCVECGATSYLEFDHVIPHSKGGASTLNNVQLLCRACNLRKGSRI